MCSMKLLPIRNYHRELDWKQQKKGEDDKIIVGQETETSQRDTELFAVSPNLTHLCKHIIVVLGKSSFTLLFSRFSTAWQTVKTIQTSKQKARHQILPHEGISCAINLGHVFPDGKARHQILPHEAISCAINLGHVFPDGYSSNQYSSNEMIDKGNYVKLYGAEISEIELQDS
ncbi:hypothetical protein OPV22_008574 [Ensete ventricosum]|uniref:Uncharacterized protein n=1 Tax=Ensete ventricosum TaxID=4639 RepID=A0AAV8RBE2_ENSVE|nr:hypothetical protein OPV22_008574 [Ensete ventricosum]